MLNVSRQGAFTSTMALKLSVPYSAVTNCLLQKSRAVVIVTFHLNV
jgi:hypothetical protein